MDNSNPEKKKVFHPIINGLQKMALYTTRGRCYLVGTNNTQTKFRVLKIDRTEPHELVLTDDSVEYSQAEIKELLSMIGGGNKTSRSAAAKVSAGVTRTVSAFGIFGFIRFLEGYYLILITKRRKVAVIGQHSIYKVEDTSIIYIPHESVRKTHDDEHKYLKLLSNMDLTSNFYFSYTYDLTHSLQHNMSPVNNIEENTKGAAESFMHSSDSSTRATEPPPDGAGEEESHYGHRSKAYEKFVWNNYLLEPLKRNAHHVWILPVIQGFIAQSNISVYGRSFFLTLIARRSALYAGTRFLKRGSNCEGDVANEVETEQIVHDAHISSQHHGRFTSFVQIRGSIPCHWSQDISKLVPKPPISIDVGDPHAVAAGCHFNKLLKRFGSPILVLNLVKRREKKRHESILNEEYWRLIRQLNLFLPPLHKIQHMGVDMARINKDKKENVMSRLAEISYSSIKKTGIFQSHPPYYMNHTTPNRHYRQLEKLSTQGDKSYGNRRVHLPEERGRYQTGIVRVNCVDCLDRTNTAQFCLGKCALAFQLYTLGVLDEPSIEFDSACVRMLEQMYEDHGDTLALQYGGSQLVHRIATYRKTAPWSSQGNDIMQSLSRYLSNTFSDQEKQQAINLFLGVFVPLKEYVPIWELYSDYLLHHTLARVWPCHRKSALQWWDEEVMDCLPLASDQVNKKPEYLFPLSKHDPRIDLYTDFNRSYEFMVMSETFAFHMNHSSSYMKRNDIGQLPFDESPFSVHGLPANTSSDPKNKISPRRKSLPFSNVSPSSNTSSGASSTETEPPTDDEILSISYIESELESDYFFTAQNPLSFSELFPPEEEGYGSVFHPVQEHDMEIYTRYAKIHAYVSVHIGVEDSSTKFQSDEVQIFEPLGNISRDDAYSISEPIVSDFSLKTYAEYIAIKERGPVPPKHLDLLKYGKWTQST